MYSIGMRVTIQERWHSGVKLDERANMLNADHSAVGALRIQVKGVERLATFKTFMEGREVNALPPLWRVEVIDLSDSYITLTGLQRTRPRGPLHFQEWRCEIMDKQKRR